jgi:hypothetical protein
LVPAGTEDSSQSNGQAADEKAAAAAAAEAEVMAAAESALTANGRIPGGHFVDMAELRRLIRQAREVTAWLQPRLLRAALGVPQAG